VIKIMKGVLRHVFLFFGLGLAITFAVGCAELGVLGDGGSLSRGRTNRGRLIDPVELPADGDGYTTPPLWVTRNYRFGTDELVDLIIGASRRVAEAHPGPRLSVADLSPLGGGHTRQHSSHQSGRDVDLLFFETDATGAPIETTSMRKFGRRGVSVDDRWVKAPPVRFDVARNWELVKTLLTAPEADVQYIFISEPLAQLLLDHARAIGEPDWLVDLARIATMQPGDSSPHDDHMHVRIFCSPTDLEFGCQDRGSRPAPKKSSGGLAALPEPMRTMAAAPMPAMLALVGRP